LPTKRQKLSIKILIFLLQTASDFRGGAMRYSGLLQRTSAGQIQSLAELQIPVALPTTAIRKQTIIPV